MALQKENRIINDTYHSHVTSLCKCVVAAIHGRYCDDWEANYALAIFHIQRQFRELSWHWSHNLGTALWDLSTLSDRRNKACNQIGFTLRHVLTKQDKCRIFSRAAAYCMNYLSNLNSDLSKEAHRIIKLWSTSRRIRQVRPWHWHRTFRRRVRHVDQLLYTTSGHGYSLANFTDIVNMYKDNKQESFSVCSIFSVNWRNVKEKDTYNWSKLPYEYICYLEYFIKILPRAGPYAPLIDMCRTRTFSPMSMVFPVLSRRAQRVIADYLKRADRVRFITSSA